MIGHTLRQVERNEHAAIYSKSKGGRVRVYEVIRIRRAKASVHPHAGPIPARECYPTSEQWGRWGWTHVTLECAKEAFAGLTAEAIAARQARNQPAGEATV